MAEELTREQLASYDSSTVRRNARLFSLAKKYLVEDAAKIYPSGQLPGGCFGCQFRSFYNKWRSLYYISPNEEKITNTKAMGNPNYKLKNPSFRVYFRGAILSASSSSTEWAEWVNSARSEDRRELRLSVFEELPEELSGKKVKSETKTKGTKSKLAKTKETKAEKTDVEAEAEAEAEDSAKSDFE